MSSTDPNNSSSMIGRDELAAILGASHASDMVVAAGTSAADIAKKSKGLGALAAAGQGARSLRNEEEDISTLDRAQAAAFVARKFKGGGAAPSGVTRHRAAGKRKRMMQHQLLAGDLMEEVENSNMGVSSMEVDVEESYGRDGEESDDKDEGFAIRKDSGRRKKIEAKVLVRRKEESRRRRHGLSDSDSDSSQKSSSSSSSSDMSSASRNRRRRGGRGRGGRRARSHSSSSSSGSEDEADRRRQRARERARMNRRDEPDEIYKSQVETNDHRRSENFDNKSPKGRIDASERAEDTEEKLQKPRCHESDDDIDSDDQEMKENRISDQKRLEEVQTNHHKSSSVKSRHRSSSNSSSSTSSNSSSSPSDESSTSSSSDDDARNEQPNLPTALSKPLFVPKSKRGTISEMEAQQQKLQEAEERRIKENERRALQSRAMVAEVVAVSDKHGHSSSGGGLGEGDEFDIGEGREFNSIPDDTDPTEEDSPELANAERDAWEVRELIRILREVDEAAKEEKERKELERRRAMTDEERLEEDRRTGRYRAPGEAQRRNARDGNGHNGGKDGKSSENNYLQRYYHRGAFYMDEDTLEQAGKDDVRHRAAEYSRAATGEDKIDKRALPEVMQVKKFGFAGYSTKYKGLAKEDTTDKSMEFLPVKGLGRGKERDDRDGGGRDRNWSRRYHP
mmetsp:Transcript_21725/g.45697  ORF Transcript_21725/g.45697 Transcript_21725/m.45697 type:complete len:679 (-) Transcript_21725:86-2122(-)